MSDPDFSSAGIALEEVPDFASQGKPADTAPDFSAGGTPDDGRLDVDGMKLSAKDTPVTELVRPGWHRVPDAINLIMEGLGRKGVDAMNWLGESHPLFAKKTKAMEEYDASRRKEYGKPMAQIAAPLTPEEAAQMPGWAAGLYNALAKAGNSFLNPEMIMAAPLFASPAAKATALAFGGQMAANAPEAWQRTFAKMRDPNATPAEAWEEGGSAAIQTIMGGAGLLHGVSGKGPAVEPAKAKVSPGKAPGPVSEFGGVGDIPVPEQPETVAAQLQWLQEGKRMAVLVTPGETLPEVPTGMKAHKGDLGTYIYDPKQVKPEEIAAAETGNMVGELLGYGIPNKPEGADTAVTVRGRDGSVPDGPIIEKQAVVTDQANAGRVIAAAQAVAGPGDTVQLEHAADVVDARVGMSAIARKALRDSIEGRETVPAKLIEQYNAGAEIPMVLPEGYDRQGDQFVFKAKERLTPEQQAVRENIRAMDELRKQKEASAAADWSVEGELAPDEPGAREAQTTMTDRPEMGAPLEIHGERPPDILDWINENYPGGVRTTSREDYGSYLDEATGKSRQLVSANRGAWADNVLKEMHDQGLYRRIDSEDGLLEAMNAAAEARKGFELDRKRLKEKMRAVRPQEGSGARKQQTSPASPQGEDTMTVYRAGDADEVGVKAFSSWTEEEGTAKAYQDNPGFGGETLRKATVPKGKILDATTTSLLGMIKLAKDIGLDTEVGQDWWDSGYRYPWEESGKAKEALRNSGYDWVRYTDDFPAGARTLLPLKDFEPGADTHSALLLRTDPIEAWLDRAIAATKPGTDWTGSTAMGLAKVPVWLGQEAAHLALKVAAEVYAKGRDLVAAIEAAVEHVRGMKLPGFNAGEVQDWLASNLGERETGQKVAASEAVSDPVKAAIGEYLYQRRTNASDEDLATAIVNQFGLDAAEKIVRDPPAGGSQAVVSKLLGEVTRTLARQELQARGRGEAAAADALAQRQAKLWDEMLPRITDMAQGLQALNDIVDMSPDAQVARLKMKLERNADAAVVRRRPETEQMRGAIEEGRKAGIEELRQDPAVNGAAAKAVDAAVAENPEVKQAIVMELAGPWAESPHILAHARELARSRVEEMMNAERVPVVRRAQYLRDALQDIAKRAATIFAAHLQGAEPGKTIVQKFQERLGLSESKAKEMAGSLQKEWDAQLKEAQAKLPRRIANARATRERNLGQSLNSPTAAVDARIRKELDALNLKLGQVLRGEAGRRDGSGQHVAERIVQASGLMGEAADTLRTVLQNRWDAIVTDAQRRTLEQLERASGTPVSRPLKGAFQKLVELDRLGALTSEKFYGVVKRALKLKELTPADAAELRRGVARAQELPEGFLRQQAAADVLKLTERLSGNVKPWDIPLAIFYANILSGITTPAKIAIENVNLLASGTVASLLTKPRELLHPLDALKALTAAYGRGLKKGGAQAVGTLRSGVVSGVWAEPKIPTILEMKPFGEKFEPLNFWKWFTRVISTAHETTFKPAWEMKQTFMARDVARREGLSGPALDQRVADLLANTEEHVTASRAQATQELQAAGKLDRVNLTRRTGEILEQQREVNMPGSTETARDFALRTAYLNEPYGFMGVIAKGIRSVIEETRKKYPVLGTGVKSQIPFTTVVANILNEKLNWTPVGALRAALSHKTGEVYGRPALPGERPELYAKAILGTVALGVMAELFGDRIHGNGPSDPRKRKQLQAAGWIPHSIKIGDKYVSYMNTPVGLGLAVIGNVLDWHRYGKGDEAEGVSRAAFAAKATANAIVSQGMLDSLKRVFESLGSESTSEGADKLEKLAARTASSFVVPNLLQQVDRLFDPTVYDQTGVEALLRSQVPFARRANHPALTVLGEPVQVGPFHYWASQVTDDPLLRILAEKQAWVTEPGRQQIIGDKSRGPDHYRAMTPDEFYNFIAISGPEIRRRLSDNLDKIAPMEPDQARKFVDKIAAEEHAKAKKSFE